MKDYKVFGTEKRARVPARNFGFSLYAAASPAFDGRGSSFIKYGRRVPLWRQVANSGPSQQGSALVLLINVARQVCSRAGEDTFLRGDGAETLLGIFCEYFAPGAVDSISLGVVRVLQFKRTDEKLVSSRCNSIYSDPKRSPKTDGWGLFRSICVCTLQVERAIMPAREVINFGLRSRQSCLPL